MTTKLKINKNNIEWIYVFELIWEIDETNADDAFKYIFENLLGNKIIYDLSRLEYWNSKFLWYLSSMNEHIEDCEWKMIISWPYGSIKETLLLAWVDKIITITKNIEEAINLIKK